MDGGAGRRIPPTRLKFNRLWNAGGQPRLPPRIPRSPVVRSRHAYERLPGSGSDNSSVDSSDYSAANSHISDSQTEVIGLILLTEVIGQRVTRTLESFTNFTREPEWVIEYDACLTGLSVIWFKILPDGSELAVGCWAADLSAWELTESGYMKSFEF